MAKYRRVGGDLLLCETIVGEIEQMVVHGELRAGDLLPSQEELAARFGVSRTVIREATKVLSARQLVTVRRGVGMVVSHPSAASVTSSLSLLLRLGQATWVQLTELRSFIEPQMALFAAERASQQQIDSIVEIEASDRVALGALGPRSTREQSGDVAASDLALHEAIWAAAGNEVAKAVLDSIVPLFRESLATTYSLPRGAEIALADHMTIAEAIAKRDGERARQQMAEHLSHALSQLRSSVESAAYRGEMPA